VPQMKSLAGVAANVMPFLRTRSPSDSTSTIALEPDLTIEPSDFSTMLARPPFLLPGVVLALRSASLAEGHVKVDARSRQVDHHHTRLAVALEMRGVFEARRANARGKTEFRVIGERQRLIIILGADEAGCHPCLRYDLLPMSPGRTLLDWRKGWDSNPRYPCRHAGFQDRCLKPLGHPSVIGSSITWQREDQEQVLNVVGVGWGRV
jgi:hypothetical protein